METEINLKFDANGLIPAVIQDSDTGDVLMLAWMNQEAYRLTTKTNQVHFWSRSRGEIWRKGATSGNTLTLKNMWIDCDADTLLLKVEAAGPVCHTGKPSCFFREIK
jgi:phosphoribosyl-AMP cyclohydrolase